MSNPPSTKAIVLIVVLVLVAVISVIGTILFRNTASKVSEIVISTPDLNTIEDGQYQGAFATDLVAATVAVTVADHKITAIDILEHRTGKGKPAEVITADVIAQQSLNVDTIAGATASSKHILKAIQIALESA